MKAHCLTNLLTFTRFLDRHRIRRYQEASIPMSSPQDKKRKNRQPKRKGQKENKSESSVQMQDQMGGPFTAHSSAG